MKKTSVRLAAFLHPRLLVGCALVGFVVVIALVGLGAFTGVSAQAQAAKDQPTGPTHKVSVTDRNLIPALVADGARVIADYGSFVLLETSDQATQRLSGKAGAQIVDENNLIMLNAGTIDTSTADAQAMRSPLAAGEGKQMRLIQFAGPVRPEWYQALAATGVRIVTYIPSNTYLVYGTPETLQKVQTLASDKAVAQWEGAYTATHRVSPAIANSEAEAKSGGSDRPHLSAKGNEQFMIQMVDDSAENERTMALVDELKQEPVLERDNSLGYLNVKVAMPKDAVVSQIAARPDVVSIHPYITPDMQDERQNIIMTGAVTGNPAVPTPSNYLAYLAGKGISTTTTSTFAVNVTDSGVDNASTTPTHFGLYRQGTGAPGDSRMIYSRIEGTQTGTAQGCDGHGTINTHIVGGYVPSGTVGGVNFAAFPHADASGFRWGLGIAPFVKMGSSVIFSPNYTNPDFEDLEARAYADGARISTNSWGANTGGAYNSDSQRYDALVRDAQPASAVVSAPGNQEHVILFSAGNAGAGANTIGTPGTGKNLITVGAAENVNPFGGADGCGTTDGEADNANDIVGFSSRGPTDDGRIKPDIQAPGTHVSGGVGQASLLLPAGTGTGAQNPCFNGTGVCGGPSGSNFFPLGQQYYTASSGTSHSTPAVAGVAALIRQHFINQSLTVPSPAMTKALLLNSTRYMNGFGAGGNLPTNSQGYGGMSMNEYFDTFVTPSVRRDQLAADTFTATGQQRVFGGSVSTSAKPFRVMLVWTDTFGPTSGNSFVNNLDLEVTVGGNTYKGNVFTGAFSTTGGAADIRNNAEGVFLPAGVTGGFSVKVTATNIAGDGIPNNAQPLDQDFAIVIYNGALAPIALGGSGSTIVSAGSNGTLDPGETVTVSLGVQNFGSGGCTSSLIGTLQATGGVTMPSGAQNYGAVCSPGAAVTRDFTFKVDPSLPCGSTVTATLALTDGATNYGTTAFTFQTGNLVETPYQNFDGVAAPALPPGWTTTFSGAGTAVTTSTTFSHTAPNNIFFSESAVVGLSEVTSPTIAIGAGGGQLSFRNLFNTEANFDGLVLEISINGAAFQDIIAAGGSFVAGGYNSTMSTGFSNPLPARQAWSGLSGGSAASPAYIITTVNLPPAAASQNIQLKWRLGSDSSQRPTTNPGARIDTIVFNSLVCAAAAPVPSTAVSRKNHGATTFDIPLPLVPISGAVGIENRVGATPGAHQMVVTFPNAVSVSSVAVTSGVGSATFSVAGPVVTINLTGVLDAQRLGVTLVNVNNGSAAGDVFVPMGILLGDVGGNGSVSGSDVSQVKAAVAAGTLNAGTFRSDINSSGTLTSTDIGVVKSRAGAVLPP